MRSCQKDLTGGIKARSTGADAQRTGFRCCDGTVFVQFARAAIVEQPECRVAALLNFGEYDARAYRMDGAGGDKEDVAFRGGYPLHKTGDRAVPDCCAQSPGRERLL